MPVDEALRWLKRLEQQLTDRRGEIQGYDDYYEGRHPLEYASEKFRRVFGGIFDEFADNWCEVVADSPEERLNVVGFRFGDDPMADQDANRMWQANQLDARSQLLHTESLINKAAAVTVWRDPDRDDVAKIDVEHPSQMIVATDTANPWKRLAALKLWTDEWTGEDHATVYLPDGIYKFRKQKSRRSSGLIVIRSGPDRGSEWVRRQPDNEPWPLNNPLGVVPVVPFPNKRRMLEGGRSEIKNVIPLQNAVNKLITDMMVASELGAMPGRWATGWGDIEDSETGERVVPRTDDYLKRYVTAPEPDTRFGTFDQATLDPFVKAIEMVVLHIAAQSRTPRHYLIQQGQALALDTEVPTPQGLTTVGQLHVGDEVYDEQGRVQQIEVLHPVLEGRPCFRVEFDDGTAVVADANHLWFTQTVYERWACNADRYQRCERDTPRAASDRLGEVRTTEEIAETLYHCNSDGEPIVGGRSGTAKRHRHSIDVAAPLGGPEVDVPVDPYVLGVWLGDGACGSPQVTQHEDDADVMAGLLEDAGEAVSVGVGRWPTTRKLYVGATNGSGRCRRGHQRNDRGRCPTCAHLHYRKRRYGEPLPAKTNLPLIRRLRELGVLNDKHIPEVYQQASFKQRLGLLQGLMDTDGTVNSHRNVALELHDEILARDAHRLVQSLGHKCALRKDTYTNAKGTWTRWRMCWTPPDRVFRLPRKARRQQPPKDPDSSTRRRRIVAVDPVDSVPVRCLTVSGPSSLFLVTRACVPTHNSPSGDALRSAESGLVAKVGTKQTFWGEDWEEVMRLAFAVIDDDRAEVVNAETMWRDPEFRTESQHIDALAKKAQVLGVPRRQLWEDAGYTPQQIRRFERFRQREALELSTMLDESDETELQRTNGELSRA